MDIADLYDHEIKKVGELHRQMMTRYAHKLNTRLNMSEFEKEATDLFAKHGFIVKVHTTECLLGIGPPTIEIAGKDNSHEDRYGFDHEHKRFEVLDSKVRGEDFRGQKGHAG